MMIGSIYMIGLDVQKIEFLLEIDVKEQYRPYDVIWCWVGHVSQETLG